MFDLRPQKLPKKKHLSLTAAASDSNIPDFDPFDHVHVGIEHTRSFIVVIIIAHTRRNQSFAKINHAFLYVFGNFRAVESMKKVNFGRKKINLINLMRLVALAMARN